MKKRIYEKKIVIGQQVELKFSSDDYDDLDLGMSGIVLHAPAKEYNWCLKHNLYFSGTLSINNDWCLLESKTNKGEIM